MAVSLRDSLSAVAPGNQVVAYLTIGDPPDRFVDMADEIIQAGAVALELGFPHPEPKEGPTLLASHQRALSAGVTTERAMELLAAVARQHPQVPLLAVVQWSALKADSERTEFLDALAQAGAAAVLPVALPLWQLPAFAAQVEQRGLQTVFACPPDASRTFRGIAFRYCSGAIYVPRGRLTGGSEPFGNVADFCRQIAAETAAPIIVGVGVNNVDDVADICRTPAKAAAVGSALVGHITSGGSAGEFVRQLLRR
jgi:tryptophan synthase alpha chain